MKGLEQTVETRRVGGELCPSQSWPGLDVGPDICAHCRSLISLLSNPAPCPSPSFSALQRSHPWEALQSSGVSVPSRHVSLRQARGHAEAQGRAGGAGEGPEHRTGGSAAGAEDKRHRCQREPEAAGRAGQVPAPKPHPSTQHPLCLIKVK